MKSRKSIVRFLSLFLGVILIVQLISLLNNPLAAQDKIPVANTEKLEQRFTPINTANEDPFADVTTTNQKNRGACVCVPGNLGGWGYWSVGRCIPC
jgi:hypothetical protein